MCFHLRINTNIYVHKKNIIMKHDDIVTLKVIQKLVRFTPIVFESNRRIFSDGQLVALDGVRQ